MSKIKLYKDPAINGSRKIKITKNGSNELHFSVEQVAKFNEVPLHFYWFAKIITLKMIERGFDLNNPYIPELLFQVPNIEGQYISGIIYKLSQHLKHWELRYIVIEGGRLHSYKKEGAAESFKVTKDSST